MPDTPDHPRNAPLWKRMLAIVYDSILLICIIWIAWQPLPFIPFELLPELVARLIRQLYLVLIPFVFFGWFWTHGGQTLGMRAWKIKLISSESTLNHPQAIGWKQSMIRYVLSIFSWAVFAIGFIWSLFDKNSLTWHDLGSKTQIIVVKD